MERSAGARQYGGSLNLAALVHSSILYMAARMIYTARRCSWSQAQSSKNIAAHSGGEVKDRKRFSVLPRLNKTTRFKRMLENDFHLLLTAFQMLARSVLIFLEVHGEPILMDTLSIDISVEFCRLLIEIRH